MFTKSVYSVYICQYSSHQLRISQAWHYYHFRQANSLGVLVGEGRILTLFCALYVCSIPAFSTKEVPVSHLPTSDNQKLLQTLPNVAWGQNHHQLKNSALATHGYLHEN